VENDVSHNDLFLIRVPIFWRSGQYLVKFLNIFTGRQFRRPQEIPCHLLIVNLGLIFKEIFIAFGRLTRLNKHASLTKLLQNILQKTKNHAFF
jgi:hypothetical protein